MSHARARSEIDRFLSTKNPEVLSVSGRWGVGKTHAWDNAINELGASSPLSRYAYVSVFGLRNLDALKTAIVQSTVKLGSNQLEPTVASFYENLSSIEGAKNLLEQGGRAGIGWLGRVLGNAPYIGKFADLLTPGAALLIRNQIICIDDIERAGDGLDVTDILGLVSSFKERKGCKVALLLNEEGLGKQADQFREYLEKVVDQAIRYEPTPAESAAVAFANSDPLANQVASCTIQLGITNIRVLRRVRRFLAHLEPTLSRFSDGVTQRTVHSIVLLGWCVFEPRFAPVLTQVQAYNQFSEFFSNDQQSDANSELHMILQAYGYSHFDQLDDVILRGLKSGAFDIATFQQVAGELDQRLAKEDARTAIRRPWNILGGSFEEDVDGFIRALIESIEDFAAEMTPGEASDVLKMLREFGCDDDADRVLSIYIETHKSRPREFFAVAQHDYSGALDPGLKLAFDELLTAMPLVRDPAQLLLDIGENDGWNPQDVAYLASVPVERYRDVIKRLRGRDLQVAIKVARRFGEFSNAGEQDREIARRMNAALRLVGEEGPLNERRVRPYLTNPTPRHHAAIINPVGAVAKSDGTTGTESSMDSPPQT